MPKSIKKNEHSFRCKTAERQKTIQLKISLGSKQFRYDLTRNEALHGSESLGSIHVESVRSHFSPEFGESAVFSVNRPDRRQLNNPNRPFASRMYGFLKEALVLQKGPPLVSRQQSSTKRSLQLKAGRRFTRPMHMNSFVLV